MASIASFSAGGGQPLAAGRRLGRYARAGWPWYVRFPGYLLLALLAAIYGYAFATYGQQRIVPFAAPLAMLAGVAMWVMPELRRPPVRLVLSLFVAFYFALLVWPDYLAISLQGLPWITAIRLIGLPMVGLLVLSLFGSSRFRARVLDIVSGDKLTWRLLVIFVIYAGFTVLLASDPGYSLNRYTVALWSWFAVAVISSIYFSRPGSVDRFCNHLLIISAIVVSFALYESVYRTVPWSGRIPSFLRIEDPIVEMLMAGSARAATGKYRVQSKFSTSIGLGEFIGLTLPFLLHVLFNSRKYVPRIATLIYIPVAFYVVVETDSRLAFISYCSSLLLYILYHTVMVWKTRRSSIFAPAVMFAYGCGAALFLVLSFTWRRLEVMIWGGGAQSFSTQSREEQVAMGLPKILANPFGHGIGEGAQSLQYVALGFDFYTIDSYYLNIALELGVFGFLVYYGMFAWASAKSAYTALRTSNPQVRYLAAASIAAANYLLSKSVYAQVENQPLAFIILGLIIALLRQDATDQGKLPPLPAEGTVNDPPPFYPRRGRSGSSRDATTV